MAGNSTKNFEKSLESLEEIVDQLESGELGLEESLTSFENGAKIYKDCRKMLASVEKRVAKLTDQLTEEEI